MSTSLPAVRARAPIARALVLLVALSVAAPGPARAHPLHTSLAELSYDPAGRVLHVSLRVFADDFAAAVTRASGARSVTAMPPDSAMYRYVAARFIVAAPGARPVALRWCGARRDGDVLLLCLRAESAAPPAGARLRNALLTELFADQVNLVQTSYGGSRRMLLFTPRDSVRALP